MENFHQQNWANGLNGGWRLAGWFEKWDCDCGLWRFASSFDRYSVLYTELCIYRLVGCMYGRRLEETESENLCTLSPSNQVSWSIVLNVQKYGVHGMRTSLV